MSDYRDWVVSLPCCISGYQGEGVDPHHIKGKAWLTGGSLSKKGSDLTCIPLVHELHMELHNNGWETFEKKYNMSQLEWMVKTILQAEKDGVIKL